MKDMIPEACKGCVYDACFTVDHTCRNYTSDKQKIPLVKVGVMDKPPYPTTATETYYSCYTQVGFVFISPAKLR